MSSILKTIKQIRVDNLKSIISDRYNNNQSLFAREVKRSRAHVFQWLNEGVAELSARNIEKALKLDNGWLDTDHTVEKAIFETIPVASYKNLNELDPETYLATNKVQIKISAGNGVPYSFHSVAANPLVFKANWWKRKGLNPDDCIAIQIRGRSMEPALHNNGTALIDQSQKEVESGEIYAVVYKQRSYIKMLKNLEDGGVKLISLNDIYGETIEVREDNLNDLHIVGKKVWSCEP